jgi:hypothetical protein
MEYEAFNYTGAAATALGLLLSLGWVCVYILGWVWAWTWAWIDDSNRPERNPVIDRSMKVFGFNPKQNRVWKYYDHDQEWGEGSDGAIGFFAPLVILFLAPLVMAFSFLFYPVTLTIFCLYLIARLARFARRHKKLFDKHIKDPEAHK